MICFLPLNPSSITYVVIEMFFKIITALVFVFAFDQVSAINDFIHSYFKLLFRCNINNPKAEMMHFSFRGSLNRNDVGGLTHQCISKNLL
ncbi:hypothetical protein OA96_07180 [Staphylococcus schleiferi]|nr:hypothetical protein OA96_07180 [Staphylococcus schleiferi]